MKEVKVILKEKDILVLEEDALKGDYINLNNLVNIDLSHVESLIKEGQDKVYLRKLEEVKQNYQEELKVKLDNKRLELENNFQNRLNEMERNHSTVLNNKQNEINSLKLRLDEKDKSIDSKIENEKLKVKQEQDNYIFSLKNEIERLKKELEINKIQEQLILQDKLSKVEEEYKIKLNDKNQEIIELNNKYAILERSKSSTGVKMLGEDLEKWCNNEMLSYMQNGFFNCTWIKDNQVMKDEDEDKGSKADYIFKVFASEEHKENEELTSVCLEMKNENPSSTNKKKNADYYKQLDKNRIKKNCKYAVLVSQLESDSPNQDVIQRVIGYKDMYVVQPAYMITFLNMITSLTTRFKELLLQAEKEKLDLIATKDLLDEFESLKRTYLENPLEGLNKKVAEIKKQSEAIRKANNLIEENCNKIIDSYINEISDKLSRFNVTRLSKKIDNINKD